MSTRRMTTCLLMVTCIGTGCATPQPQVPPALQVPVGQTLYLEIVAKGVQIYQCARQPDGSYAWSFKGPEATLNTLAGEPVGKHYAGPTWEALDGSTVVGEVKVKDPGPNPTAIPWLLLAAKANTGTGVFAETKSIQRLATEGGTAPTTPCTAEHLNEMARIPYAATYHFFR